MPPRSFGEICEKVVGEKSEYIIVLGENDFGIYFCKLIEPMFAHDEESRFREKMSRLEYVWIQSSDYPGIQGQVNTIYINSTERYPVEQIPTFHREWNCIGILNDKDKRNLIEEIRKSKVVARLLIEEFE